ncbi:cytochrome P450 [Mycena rebaudengoi]|nr:cytochrome P450 [Mycena rebaudengoi]
MPSPTVLCALLALAYCIRAVARRLWLFSALDNIPGPPRASWIAGNVTQFHDPNGWVFQTQLEEHYAQVVKLHGPLGGRELYVFDPAALESILIKGADTFEEPGQHLAMNRLLFGKGLFSTEGGAHRKYRKVMLPAFSTANLRRMLPLFYEIAEKARDGLIAPHVQHGPKMLDFNTILCRTSLELIGRTGIGYSFDPMVSDEDPTDQYADALRSLFGNVMKLALFLPLLPLLEKLPLSPSVMRFLMKLVPSAALHQARDNVDLMRATASMLVRERRAAMSSEKHDEEAEPARKDIMSLLLKSNASAERGMRLTDEELFATTSMILFAATDTTSSSMNRVFHTLASYPAVQERLRAEISAAAQAHGAHINHDALMALPYLDGFVRELLRLFPPVSPALYREARADALLPLRTPITGVDGTSIHSIMVPKGTNIYIATAAANHNTAIWGPDAREFKPERWAEGRATGVKERLCGVFGLMSFLGGERGCLGFKFAELEMKVAIWVLLRAYRFLHPDPSIEWPMTGVIPSPHVGGVNKMPILVERLES